MTKNSIKFQISSILHIQLHNYNQEFTFIVNNEIFHTTRVIADLLSPKISRYHFSDPTNSEYIITTKSQGNFKTILNLLNFEDQILMEEELPFISEIFDELEIIDFDICLHDSEQEYNINNVFDKLQKHHKFRRLYKNDLENDIEYIAEHFYELNETERRIIQKYDYEIIEKILSHSKIQIETENDFIQFINELYLSDVKYSKLYSYVYFMNVSSEMMKEFIKILDFDDISKEIWESVCYRLTCEIKNEELSDMIATRYTKPKQKTRIQIFYSNQEFGGVINYLQNESNIKEEVNITYSSAQSLDAWNLFLFNDKTKHFYTQNKENSWICFEFIKNEIIPTNYTIRSCNQCKGWYHPKSWVIEGSMNKSEWEKIDEEINCSYLNGESLVHTFPIKNENNHSFKYLRIRNIDKNWGNYNYLEINSIEFYGTLVEKNSI